MIYIVIALVPSAAEYPFDVAKPERHTARPYSLENRLKLIRALMVQDSRSHKKREKSSCASIAVLLERLAKFKVASILYKTASYNPDVYRSWRPPYVRLQRLRKHRNCHCSERVGRDSRQLRSSLRRAMKPVSLTSGSRSSARVIRIDCALLFSPGVLSPLPSLLIPSHVALYGNTKDTFGL